MKEEQRNFECPVCKTNYKITIRPREDSIEVLYSKRSQDEREKLLRNKKLLFLYATNNATSLNGLG